MYRATYFKIEGGPDRSVSNNECSSVTLNELALDTVISFLNKAVKPMTGIPPNGIRISKFYLEYISQNLQHFLIS